MGSDLLSSLSNHSKRSSHGKDEFLSVTVRKDDPKQKAGIRLEAEENGRIRVVNIATNGLFAGSEIEIGDVVLSINGKRLAKGEGPETLVDVIQNAESKVTVVVKKTNMAPRVPEKPKKDTTQVMDNNVTHKDSYYAGQSKHKEDGSFAFTTSTDIQSKKEEKQILSCTITANKEDQSGEEIDNTAGLSFVVQRKLLFVSDIAKDSVFQKTNLQVGDRVLSINDCNFRAYADANFATKIVGKANNAVTLIVEKGVEGFKPVSTKSTSSSSSTTTDGIAVPARRRRSRDGKRSSSASKRSSDKEKDSKTVLRRMLKKNDSNHTDSSDIESTDSLSAGSFGDDGEGDDDDVVCELGLPMSRSNYKEVVIAAPKAFSSQEVGVLFETKKNRYIVVHKIADDSIFAKTSLEPGDIILEINDVNYRNNPDKLDAWKTCKITKETVTMLVLKEDAKFKQQVFNLDASTSNLDWQ